MTAFTCEGAKHTPFPLPPEPADKASHRPFHFQSSQLPVFLYYEWIAKVRIVYPAPPPNQLEAEIAVSNTAPVT